MPYPPPAGPPELGIFQAIGLVPELPPLVGNYFLTNQSGLTVWEPISGGVLPDMTGHGGEFLTTNGTVASWASSLPSVTGQAGHYLTNDGSTALWSSKTPALSINPVDYGALGNGIVDDAIGIQAALNAALPNPSANYPTGGTVEFGPGTWYLGQPLCITAGANASRQASALTFRGAGAHSTVLTRHPTILFQGPLVVVNAPGPYFQGFVAGFVGGGQALAFSGVPAFNPSCILLGDSTAFAFQDLSFPNYTQTTPKDFNIGAFSFQTNLKYTLNTPNDNLGYIAASYGTLAGVTSSAFSVRFRVNSVTGINSGYIDVGITTTNGSASLSTLAPLSVNTKYNLEVSYDGANVGLWLEGVLQDSAALTGFVAPNEWETWSLGGIWSGGMEGESGFLSGFQGALDSTKFSNTARHTVGGGDFTPPAAKYTFDANTLFLLNCDQGTSDYGFILAQGPKQSATGLPTDGVPVIHYARFAPGNAKDWTLLGVKVQDFALLCKNQGPGIIYNGHIISQTDNLYINSPYRWGLRVGFNYNTFYDFFSNIWIEGGFCMAAFDCSGTSCNARDITISTGLIAFNVASGSYDNIQLQGNGNAMSGLRVTEGGQGIFSGIWARALSTDNESPLSTNWIASAILEGQISQGFFAACAFVGPSLGQTGGKATPVIAYNGQKAGCRIKFDTCLIAGGSSFAFQDIPNAALPSTTPNWIPMLLEDSRVTPTTGQLQDDEAATRTIDDGHSTLVRGLSTSAVAASNLAGTVSVLHGFTTGSVLFDTPEPDGNFDLVFQAKSYVGSGPPAAGSTTVLGYTTSATGFTITVAADPGGDDEVTFSWHLIRTKRPPLLSVLEPAIPSNYANPLAGSSGDWAIGASILPLGSNVNRMLYGTNEVIAAAGAPLNANSWMLGLVNSVTGGTGAGTGSSFVGIGAFVDSFVRDGKLCGLLNPGPHNIAWGQQGITVPVCVDGKTFATGYFLTRIAGTQQTPIYVGEYSDTTLPLTSATIRHLKFDSILANTITLEPDWGPLGTPEALVIGDSFTVGSNCLTVGSFASQIADIRYGDTYYWLGAARGQTSDVALVEFWRDWGASQPALQSMCLFMGFSDLLGISPATGRSAVDVWADLEQMLDGIAATATMKPPVANGRAWAGYVPPFRGVPGPHTGSATCVINGVSFTCTFNTNDVTTINDLIALVNASGPTLALVTPSLNTDDPVNPYMRIDAVADGFAGNGISTSTDGAHGAYWYPGPATYAGANATLVIEGVSFDILFNTDADTTVNDAIALINASGPTAALVTPSNVASQLLLTAVAAGTAGNSISVSTNGAYAALVLSPAMPAGGAVTLSGGADGAISKSIPNIILCTIPPFGLSPNYTAGKEAERASLNTTIRAFVGAGVTIADVDVALRDPGNHAHILPAFLSGADDTYLTDAGQEALFVLLAPLLPGAGTPPSALSYATNPASYASGGPIATNSPTVTGSTTNWVVSPPLPAGLSINATTGDIDGTPTTPTAAADYTVCASNAGGSTTVLLNITIT